MVIADTNTRVTVTLTKEQHDRIQELAEGDARSISSMTARLISQALKFVDDVNSDE